MKTDGDEVESLVIRPPSEWRSMLVRLTRGCAWNRCRFCGLYPALGEPSFSARTIEEVKSDIDRLKERVSHATTVFFGDADPLRVGLDEFIEIAQHLRNTFPDTERLTCYARASTLWKLGRMGIGRLADAGLDRVHVGLESGDAETLRYHRKGQTPQIVIESGEWLKVAGIEISFYVLLGLGGAERWKQHIDGTVAVINRVDPEFVRLRRIWLYRETYGNRQVECPLWKQIDAGEFEPQTPEGTVLELRRLLAGLTEVGSFVTCDHANNYVRVEGQLPGDRDAMLHEIDQFLALPEPDRLAHYGAVGSQV